MENSIKFIEAYNKIDKTLRSQYSLRPNIGFSEIIRQTAHKNFIVKKFEEELYSYGRLRNAIVHNITDIVIAEPHNEVVKNITHIATLLTSPPKVIEVLEKSEIVTFDYNNSLFDVVEIITKYGYSNIPVYNDGKIAGVINSKQTLRAIGELIQEGNSITDKMLKAVRLSDININDGDSYVFADRDITIIQALEIFYGSPKLKAIILTKNGDRTAPALRIVTSSNFVMFSDILDKI